MRTIPALVSSLLIVMIVQGRALAQIPRQEPDEFWRAPATSGDVANGLIFGAEPLQAPPRTPRIQMFRMLPGFLSEPMTVAGQDDLADSSCSYESGNETGARGLDAMVVSFGHYNPYFDMRRAGDPGGVGYLHMHSQLQVFESGGTSVCMGLRAWTPAGAENGGVAEGPTTFAPGLGAFQDLGNGTALHGYLDQGFRGACKNHGALHYGMGVQCPLIPWTEPDDRSVYFFVQALGRYDYAGGLGRTWEFVPGIYWRLSDNFLMSVGGTRSNLLTWMWQF